MGSAQTQGVGGRTRRRVISLGLALASQIALAGNYRAGPGADAREVTSGRRAYDEVGPVCSPDGRWLAFEYHERGDPNYPHVGIMRLDLHARSWQPLLKEKSGWHLFAGDMSWSPDSRWLALLTDYPSERRSFWSTTNIQVAKVNIYTREVVQLTHLPPNTPVGSTTAWMRSGWIVFSGLDGSIYGVSEKGGNPRKFLRAPVDKCGGGTNTLAASPDGQNIAFAMNYDSRSQIAECNALWVADLKTRALRRGSTAGLQPLNPFWLSTDTILFSGVYNRSTKWMPLGIYSVSLSTGRVVRLLKGTYLTPFVCDSGKMLYFSWGQGLRTQTPTGAVWPTFNDFYGFHIWTIPLRDVLR